MDAPNSQDDFKWFGEGFDGFPKRLPDDTVEYAIYVIDSKQSLQKNASQLRQVHQKLKTFTKDLLADYIWQRDAFNVELVLKEGFWSLQGQTNFGDSVADEWLIVYLLREISKQCPEIWIRIYDTDGEFLLIESANVLPRWLKPEIAENRIWIHAGELLIIPMEGDASSAKAPTLVEAINFISSNQNKLLRSPLIEEEAFYRIGKYPQAIAEQFHRSLIIIPRKVAHILHQKPEFVSPAIDAFYLRDAVSLQIFKDVNISKLIFPPDDLVKSSVRFTRVGFAQLKGQEFAAPECWKDKVEKFSESDLEKAYIGMKLTCGFEMLLYDKQSQNKKSVRELQILLEDLDNGDDELPTDQEMNTWSKADDSMKWMDIDFNEFDKELSGKTGQNDPLGEGFGDKAAQENLRRMVARFENFLNDDKAGLEGANLGNSDSDEDSEETDDDMEEDQVVSFDEEEFARMMHEMMGLPPEDHERTPSAALKAPISKPDDANKIQKDMDAIEAELKEAGVLDLNRKQKSRAITDHAEVEKADQDEEEDDEDEDDAVHVDLDLARNMLEAFKSQGGGAGPASNLMGLMNVHFPPDKDD